MALPTTISGIVLRQPCGGPHDFNSGFYVVGRDSTTASTIDIHYSTDPSASGFSSGSTWSLSADADSIHSVINGSSILVVVQRTDGVLNFRSTSSDGSFVGGTTTIDSNPDSSVNFCSIGVRSDGDILVAYMGQQDSIMGTGYDRVKLAREEGAGWTSAIAAGAGDKTEVNERYPFGVMSANDRFHVFFFAATGSALVYSTYTGSNSFGHQNTTGDSSSLMDTRCGGYRFDDSGTEKIRFVYNDQPGPDVTSVVGFDDADNPGSSISISNDFTGTDSGRERTATVDTATATQYAVVKQGTTTADIDIWSTGAGDDTWSKLEDAHLASLSSLTIFSANVYDNGGTVLAYLYRDGSNYRYNERSLSSGVTFAAALASFTQTGQAATITRQIPFSAALASYTLSGQTVDITLSVTFAAEAGNFTLAGQAADITRQLLLSADVGALTLAGQTASITRQIPVALDAGNFAFSGLAATFSRSVPFLADAGNLTFSGQDAAITRALLLNADLGNLTFSGLDPTITISINIAMDQAAFTFGGQDATLTRQLLLEADAGTLTQTGLAATITRQIPVGLDLATFSLSGQTADITKSLVFAAEAGGLTLSGQEASFLAHYLFDAALGALGLTGDDVTITRQVPFNAELAALTFVGQDADTLRQLRFEAAVAPFTFNGLTMVVDVQGTINMDLGTFTFTGIDATITPPASAGGGLMPVFVRRRRR